jgi:hypothetical protein
MKYKCELLLLAIACPSTYAIKPTPLCTHVSYTSADRVAVTDTVMRNTMQAFILSWSDSNHARYERNLYRFSQLHDIALNKNDKSGDMTRLF